MAQRSTAWALALLLALAMSQHGPRANEVALPPADSASAADICLDLPDAEAVTAQEVATAAETFREGGVLDPDWPPDAIGGMIPPIRTVADPFPTFDGMAVDTVNDKVIFSDENRHSLLVYDRTAGSFSDDITEPAQWVFGPKTRMGFVAGVEVDPKRQEFYTVNNDGGDQMVVFSYADHGNVAPRRRLTLPHQSWDVSLAAVRDELAISIQQSNAISIFKRDARGQDAPIRTIRGLKSQLEDPHGIFFDDTHGEIITANHGNWTQIRPYTPYDPLTTDLEYRSGWFNGPSITVHAATANGDIAPLRVIEGQSTQLNWPMGIDVDLENDEIAVANYGDSSVRFYRRSGEGEVTPLRTIRGAATKIVGPVSVAIDLKNDEIWVANYGDHSAVVFPRTAVGNVKPKRIIRNAPVNAATCGFTNASAAAYDSKRDEILVPN